MSLSIRPLPFLLSALLLSLSPTAQAADPVDTSKTADRYGWLEDVEGAKSMEWVRGRNAKSVERYASRPDFKALEADILKFLDSKAKIPGVSKIGEHYYNLWKDAANPRGLWRRTTLAEYRKDQPQWETVLDLDALGKAENENWVFKGADCPRPYDRCLINVSRGGADAVVVREFDLTTKQFVKDGFQLPESKGNASYLDRDHVFVSTDFGPGSMTKSGYARIVKLWKRGTPLSSAQVVYEGKPEDMMVAATRDHTPGYERSFVMRMIAFYNDELFEVGKDSKLTKIDVPASAQKSVHRDWLFLELREAYEGHPAGSLIVTPYADFMAGKRNFTSLFKPDAKSALSSMTMTRDHLVINVLKDVKNQFTAFRFPATPAGAWNPGTLPNMPALGTTSVSAVDGDELDALWMTSTDYLTPTTLSWVEVGGAPETLKSNPTLFDSSSHVAEQHFATSKDGTRVPYFLVRPKNATGKGDTPTLLYGYGGFEISMLPGYSGSVGKGWLEKGGAYAVANIRGGGEYGPAWHQAALKQNRHKAYEDFAAVAQDLIDRKITAPKHLGIQGGSNGGLLTGNMLTQYPDLFGAVVVQVPLLDMKRYTHLLAGASWAAEYGDPDTKDWEFIQKFSPYHLFDAKRNYPATLFTTSTRDDRVHPGHARKMMAVMDEAGKDVYYYENIEGGHGGAATNAQTAFMSSLAYTFLWDQLGGE